MQLRESLPGYVERPVILMRAKRAEDLLLLHAVRTDKSRSSGCFAAIRMTPVYCSG